MTVFEEAAVRNFEDRMLAHLKDFAPNHSKILTEDEMRMVIRHGIKKAESHGFTLERGPRIYTELILMFGSSFDADPQLPWAADVLSDETMTNEIARIDRLQEKAWEYADWVLPDSGSTERESGPKSFIEQFRQLRREGNEVLEREAVSDFYQRAITQLNQALPRKCELLGEQSLRRLIKRGIELARSYNITTERGCAFFVAGMFMLGSGFDQDPQFPWAARILNDQSVTDQNARVDQLFTTAIDYLTRFGQ